MNFAVDVNLKINAITGWASGKSNNNLDDCLVSIYRNNILLASTTLNVMRKDVKDAGHHPDGLCGFCFLEKDIKLVKGNIYLVKIFSRENSKSKLVLYGNSSKISKEYDKFEIIRNDFSILNIKTSDLFIDGEDLLSFKKLMIRLRRGKRAHSMRLSFRGEPYLYVKEDWEMFRSFVDININLLLQMLSVRNIWSILDTFTDYAEIGERTAALAVSNILYQERFAQTYKCIYDFTEKRKKVITGQIDYWGGMKTNSLARDDAYDLFITRNLDCLKQYPLINRFFVFFIKKMINSETSILHFNISNSSYFNEMAIFYKKHI